MPPTDVDRARMIHAFRWSRRARVALTALPRGTYAVYVYVWEETRSETISIWLDDRRVVRDYESGPPGRWRRLGPWITPVEDGELFITSRGGAANFSGIEVWRRVPAARE